MSPSKKEMAISTLAQAEADLAAAQDAHESARKASAQAVAHAADLRAQVTSGATNVTAADLSASTAAAEHAALTFRGAADVLPALSAKVAAARADEAADEVVETLPQLGLDVALALASLEEALPAVVAACRAYDAYIETATSRLQTVARPPEDLPQLHGAPPKRGTMESPFGDHGRSFGHGGDPRVEPYAPPPQSTLHVPGCQSGGYRYFRGLRV